MAIPSAKVEDGKLVYDYTDNSQKANTPSGSTLGYDQFLQLLCAEMQYQDPLEPTSNTEYVAQLATFSQLEATLSLQGTQQSSMANDLVGKTVIMKVVNETTGATSYVDGKVDYVMNKDEEIYLSVNNKLYPLSDLDTVADDAYYEAMGLAKSVENMLGQLPAVENITADYEPLISQVAELYDGMTDYQKGFVSDEAVKTLNEYRAKVEEEVKKAKTAAENVTQSIQNIMEQLPSADQITLEDEDLINRMGELYDSLNSYQKNLVSSDVTSNLKAYQDQLATLKGGQEEIGTEA